MKIIENFYRSFFINELIEFEEKSGIKPTHCVIDSEIYERLKSELTMESLILTTDKVLTYYGIELIKGNGNQLFYFYKR